MALENTVTTGYRLSPVQERVWAQQRDSDHQAYRIEFVLSLTGPLDRQRLKHALEQVVERHEILRTVYHRQPGMTTPFQVVLDRASYAWTEIDLTAVREQREREIEQYLASQPAFDLHQDPLVRATLFVPEPQKHLLHLALPALSADAVTASLVAQEIAHFYAPSGGDASDAEFMQYVDVGEWQHELSQSEDTKAAREYWRDYWRSVDLSALSGVEIPGGNSSKAAAEFVPAHVDIVAPSDIGSRLAEAAKRCGCSPEHLLLACWKAYLARVTGR